MMRLDNRCVAAAGLDDIRVDSSLNEIIDSAYFLGFLLENSDELLTYDLALGLRLAHASELAHELLFCIDTNKVYIPVPESCLDLVALVFAHKAVIYEDAGELAADSL